MTSWAGVVVVKRSQVLDRRVKSEVDRICLDAESEMTLCTLWVNNGGIMLPSTEMGIDGRGTDVRRWISGTKL